MSRNRVDAGGFINTTKHKCTMLGYISYLSYSHLAHHQQLLNKNAFCHTLLSYALMSYAYSSWAANLGPGHRYGRRDIMASYAAMGRHILRGIGAGRPEI